MSSEGSIENWILPIFVGKQGTDWQPIEFAGTGFVLFAQAADVFVTCWHCVNQPLDEGYEYRVAFSDPSGSKRALQLNFLEQDRNGSDLATAIVMDIPRSPFHLAEKATETADWVRTYGYPLTRKVLLATGSPSFALDARYLEGYVTQAFVHERPGWGSTPSYELDMPTPAGLSGAPLIDKQTGLITGVIYGGRDTYAITELATVDPRSGEQRPEVQRIVNFGLAHYLPTLRNCIGMATGGRPLGLQGASP